MDLRDYQSRIKNKTVIERIVSRLPRLAGILLLTVAAIYLFSSGAENGTVSRYAKTPARPEAAAPKPLDVGAALKEASFLNLREKNFDLSSHGRTLRVETSLDISLQRFILEKMARPQARYVAIVAMNPEDGKIIAMAGHDRTDPGNNPCIDSLFPSASIFKIVTAAAAIEKCGFDADQALKYNGNKYTLYKSQIRDLTTRYTHRTTFRESFAQSINPIFGKIGALELGRDSLQEYAEALGFNRPIPFEVPLPQSRVSLSDEPYRLAEIASGYNRETRITPVHGALIASIVLNRGGLVDPAIVERVVGEDGKVLYQDIPPSARRAITPETSRIMGDMMGATVDSGTARKSFRKYRQDPVLSRLDIGGKTGSIENDAHDTRFDWFVGFAREKRGPRKIAVSIVVGHEKVIGVKSSQYARWIIQRYFENIFTAREEKAEGGKSRS